MSEYSYFDQTSLKIGQIDITFYVHGNTIKIFCSFFTYCKMLTFPYWSESHTSESNGGLYYYISVVCIPYVCLDCNLTQPCAPHVTFRYYFSERAQFSKG